MGEAPPVMLVNRSGHQADTEAGAGWSVRVLTSLDTRGTIELRKGIGTHVKGRVLSAGGRHVQRSCFDMPVDFSCRPLPADGGQVAVGW